MSEEVMRQAFHEAIADCLHDIREQLDAAFRSRELAQTREGEPVTVDTVIALLQEELQNGIPLDMAHELKDCDLIAMLQNISERIAGTALFRDTPGLLTPRAQVTSEVRRWISEYPQRMAYYRYLSAVGFDHGVEFKAFTAPGKSRGEASIFSRFRDIQNQKIRPGSTVVYAGVPSSPEMTVVRITRDARLVIAMPDGKIKPNGNALAYQLVPEAEKSE